MIPKISGAQLAVEAARRISYEAASGPFEPAV
jgi:hypothetical protein